MAHPSSSHSAAMGWRVRLRPASSIRTPLWASSPAAAATTSSASSASPRTPRGPWRTSPPAAIGSSMSSTSTGTSVSAMPASVSISTVQSHANSAKYIRGRWVYLYGVLRAILPPKSIELQLTVDGRRVDFRGLTAGFANSGRYGGGLKLSPEAKLDDGLIDVVLLRDAFLPRLAVELVAFMSGRHDRHPHIHFGHAREIHIDTPAGAAPVAIVADGDEIGQTPTAVTIRPSSLKVRVPHAGRP